MSSRQDYRRRDRSWERDERDRDRARGKDRYGSSRSGKASNRDEKRRTSRSRSPRRGDRDKERDRDKKDRRDRDYDYKRHDGHRDNRDDRKKHWDRDDKREPPRREDRDDKHSRDIGMKDHGSTAPQSGPSSGDPDQQKGSATSSVRPSVDPNTPDYVHEDGEAIDDVNDNDDAATMAAMGLSGFGSTKGKQVTGNQEGATNIKKTRTWRQYMNRRGGFNRPLDKIK